MRVEGFQELRQSEWKSRAAKQRSKAEAELQIVGGLKAALYALSKWLYSLRSRPKMEDSSGM